MSSEESSKKSRLPSVSNPFGKGGSLTIPSVNAREAAENAMQQVLQFGIDGRGPWKGAEDIASEHLAHHKDRERAISRLIATHVRNTGVSGLVTGMGGLITLPAAIPADMAALYTSQIRMIASIAHLRGYDVHSEEVRSIILLTLLGSAGTAMAAELGVTIGNKTALAMLKRVPGRVFIDINKKVGFRLFTKAGTKGVINMTKVVPMVGGVIGGTVNATGTHSVGAFAKRNFPSLLNDGAPAAVSVDSDVVQAEIVGDDLR